MDFLCRGGQDRTAKVKMYLLGATDEWRGYSKLMENGLKHETVNHSKNFVNFTTKFHTQAIERSWIEGKESMRRARSLKVSLQSHFISFVVAIVEKDLYRRILCRIYRG